MLRIFCVIQIIGISIGAIQNKIFVETNVNSNTLFVRPQSPIRPTSATVEFIPGVPPGWTTTEEPPTRQTVSTGAPFVIHPNTTHEEILISNNRPSRGTFIDWLLGLIGLGGGTGENEAPDYIQEPKNCPKCSCGLTYKRRIVGGIETIKNQYPWMTALTYNNRFYCGASVINNKYLLTAAHCVNGFAKERLAAVFLDHDRSNHFETQTFSRSISKIFRHRAYGSGGSYNNDIALLRLDKELSITGLLKPVCLPQQGKSFTGSNGIAIGWGATHVHGQVSPILREVEVPIMSNNECRRTGYGNKITENMICAGLKGGSKDSCQGDSGGPLHILNGTTHHIVGVVSWGEGCAEPNFPGVYTRVNRFLSWIKSNTRDACYC